MTQLGGLVINVCVVLENNIIV